MREALARSGRLPWRNPADWELSMDRGLTMQPRRKEPGRWYLLYAGAAEIARRDRLPSAPALKRVPGADAMMVIEAIKKLPPAEAAQVLTYGRDGRRPDFIADDLPPRRVIRHDGEIKIVQWGGPKKRRQRIAAYCPLDWPVDPETICASQRLYGLWHAGMTRLARQLDGQLKGWPSIGFFAPAEPWKVAPKQAA